MEKRLRYLIVIIFIFTFSSVKSQISISKLNLGGDITKWYDSVIGIENAGILEGSYYLMPSQSPLEHQTYKKFAWANGDLVYNGQVYRSIDMMYNLFYDILIIRNVGISSSTNQAILPNQNLITSFKIHGNEFIHLSDSLSSNMAAGYYQLSYKGRNIDLLVKWSKKQNTESTVVTYFEESSAYFKYKDTYIKYTGERSLLNLFPERKREVKKYIRNNLGYLGKHADQKLVTALLYCDQMTVNP